MDLTPVADGVPAGQPVIHFNFVIQSSADVEIKTVGLDSNQLIGYTPGTFLLGYRNNQVGAPKSGGEVSCRIPPPSLLIHGHPPGGNARRDEKARRSIPEEGRDTRGRGVRFHCHRPYLTRAAAEGTLVLHGAQGGKAKR